MAERRAPTGSGNLTLSQPRRNPVETRSEEGWFTLSQGPFGPSSRNVGPEVPRGSSPDHGACRESRTPRSFLHSVGSRRQTERFCRAGGRIRSVWDGFLRRGSATRHRQEWSEQSNPRSRAVGNHRSPVHPGDRTRLPRDRRLSSITPAGASSIRLPRGTGLRHDRFWRGVP
jgi:hypothetical protein